MKTRNKILLTFIITAVVLLAVFSIFIYITNKRILVMQDIQKHSAEQSLRSIIKVRSDYYASMVKDYSCFDEMVDFIHKPSTAWAKSNIEIIRYYKMAVIWILDADQKMVWEDYQEGLHIPCFLGPETFARLREKRECNFFVKTGGRYLQILGSTIHPTSDADRKSEPRGFLLVGKLWDSTSIAELEELTNSRIRLFDVRSDSIPANSPESIKVSLQDERGNPIAVLVSQINEPLLVSLEHITLVSRLVLTASFVVIGLILLLAFNYFVVGPMGMITLSLRTGDAKYIRKLADKSGEFGNIARLMVEFFEHRNLLAVEIENRKKAETRLQELNEELLGQKKEMQDNHDDLFMLNEELTEQKDEIEGQRNYLSELNNELKSKTEEIAWQRDQIAYQKEQLTDSLKYARRIQRAVLPGRKLLNQVFPDNFILFLPHSIISGDFYFITHEKGQMILAVADCTGHGVPGALMSMLGISLLNEITSRHEEVDPALILTELREEVIDAFRESRHANEYREGMEICIITIDPVTLKMVYAGANHPLYLYRKGNLIEFCPDKTPIGNYILHGTYSNQTYQLEKGDSLYMFSDGYADQLGGPKGGRFKKKLFKQYLGSLQKETMHDQKIFLEENLEKWRTVKTEGGGPFEQTDDILVLGLRI